MRPGKRDSHGLECGMWYPRDRHALYHTESLSGYNFTIQEAFFRLGELTPATKKLFMKGGDSYKSDLLRGSSEPFPSISSLSRFQVDTVHPPGYSFIPCNC